MTHDVFLSYSRKDSAMKDRVKKTLEDAGLRVWTDDNLTLGTPEWFQAIERAIDATHVLVVLLSPDAKQSEWVQKEIGYAKAGKKPIFPILVRGEESESVPFQIFGTQFVDVRDARQYAIQMDRLIEILRFHTDVSSKGVNPPKATKTQSQGTSSHTTEESAFVAAEPKVRFKKFPSSSSENFRERKVADVAYKPSRQIERKPVDLNIIQNIILIRKPILAIFTLVVSSVLFHLVSTTLRFDIGVSVIVNTFLAFIMAFSIVALGWRLTSSIIRRNKNKE